MSHRSHKRSSLFLMELIIAILFFAITSAICLQCFAKAHSLSRETTALNHAVSHTESIAELLRSASTDSVSPDQVLETLKLQYPACSMAAGQWSIFFDQNWANCPKPLAFYTICITEQSAESGLYTYTIDASYAEHDADIYQLTVTLYTKE